jgi:hypothetical protein
MLHRVQGADDGRAAAFFRKAHLPAIDLVAHVLRQRRRLAHR